jgi:hypothetical protein
MYFVKEYVLSINYNSYKLFIICYYSLNLNIDTILTKLE